MMKKSLLAILMASLMLVTIFSAISVNAAVDSNENVKLINDSFRDNTDGMEVSETGTFALPTISKGPDLRVNMMIVGRPKSFFPVRYPYIVWDITVIVRNVGLSVAKNTELNVSGLRERNDEITIIDSKIGDLAALIGIKIYKFKLSQEDEDSASFVRTWKTDWETSDKITAKATCTVDDASITKTLGTQLLFPH